MRVLIVRLREIGDVVFTTPAVRAIRETFPRAHITYLVEPAAAPVVTESPHIDEVVVVPRRKGLANLLAEAALIRRLRADAFDVAIDFHGGPRASILTWLSGARIRIGYDVVGRSWMYTRRVARPRALRARHSVENQADLLAALDMSPAEATRFPVEMTTARAAVEAVEARLAEQGVHQRDRLIVMHVSAGNPFRRWPVASFVEVAPTLAGKDSRRRIVVTSGPSEQEAAQRVITEARAHLSGSERHRVVSCSEFSLAELRALVERAALYIGGDSGPMHVAATSRVPIVGLYGPTLPARSAPWRSPELPAESLEVTGLPCRPCDQRVCVPGDFRCLTWISSSQVIEAAERAMSRAAG
jgi:lipopolysaccharide heptosyltransferase II